MTERGICWCFV